MVAATDYVFSDKAGTIEVLKARIKGLSDADAAKLYDRLTGPGGLNKRAALNIKGVETVLKLRTLMAARRLRRRKNTSTSAITIRSSGSSSGCRKTPAKKVVAAGQ